MASNIAKFIQGIGTLTIGLALLIGLYIANGYISTGLTGKTISVTGKARQFAQKDQSVISGTWQVKASTSEKARQDVRAKAAKALDALKAAGVNEKKIDTTEATTNPIYDYRSGGESKITGYHGTTTLEVTLEDATKSDEIIGIMNKNAALSTSGPHTGFSNTKLDEIEKNLRQQAVTDARAQAEVLAKEAGAKLGDVVSVGTGGVSYPYSYRNTGIMPMLAAEDSSDKSDISISEEEITATISVIYQLK